MMFTYDIGTLWIDHENATASFPLRGAHYFDDSHHLTATAYAIDDADMETPRGISWADVVSGAHALTITVVDFDDMNAYQFVGTLEGWTQAPGYARVALRFRVVGPPHVTTSMIDVVVLE